MIVLAFAKSAEALDGVGEVDELARRSREDFGDEERLRQEALDLARAATVILSSSDNSSMPRMAMMSCSDLYRCSAC